MAKLQSAQRAANIEGPPFKRGGRTASLAARRVERVIRQMREPLVVRYCEIRDLLFGSIGDTARVRHRVGQITLEVMNDRARYGQRAVALLATAIGRNEDTLYKWARVAEIWSKESFEELLRETTAHGVPLSISQLIVLAGTRDAIERRQLIDEALRHGLSTKALQQLAERRSSSDAGFEEDEESATGCRLLSRLSANAAVALRRASRLAASFESVPEDELQDPQFIGLLESSIDKHRELARWMSETVQRLETRLTRLREVPRPGSRAASS